MSIPEKVFIKSAEKKITAKLESKSGAPVNGAKITLKVDGKTYVATTNAQGTATFIVSLNTIGTYTATGQFATSRFFNGATTSTKIIII